MNLLEDKSAVVTGASSGIGRATAKLFAEHGANVVVADVAVEAGEETVEEIEAAGGTATFAETNVAEPEAVKAMIETAVSEYGRLDVLYNNAGIEGEVGTITEQSVDGFDDVVNVNLKGVWTGLKYGIEAMQANENGGSIISTSSIGGLSGIPTYSVYGATKAGVSLMTKTAANEYAAENIRVNAVAPGIVETEMITRVLEEDPDQREGFLEMEPMPGLAQPEEIASAVVFLASDLASRVTGVTLPVEGGKLA